MIEDLTLYNIFLRELSQNFAISLVGVGGGDIDNPFLFHLTPGLVANKETILNRVLMLIAVKNS